MGDKFADNTRFTFQYICSHKEQYGIKKVIWVTRNNSIYKELSNLGYDVVLCGTCKSFYYHVKSGFHFICNMSSSNKKFKGDIDGNLSCGAIKIQMWHGIGVKAIGFLRSDETNNYREVPKFIYNITSLFSAGCWKNAKWIVTGETPKQIFHLDSGIRYDNFIITNYARNFGVEILMPNELEIKKMIFELKKNDYKLLFYLPTFRNETTFSGYVNPLTIDGFDDFLKKNNLKWFEKQHSASSIVLNKLDSENIIYLSADFDINTILADFDLIISDYSSVTSDAIYNYIKTLDYIPDYQQYACSDRGFVIDYDLFHPGTHVKEASSLEKGILDSLSLTDNQVKELYKTARNTIFDSDDSSIGMIISTILRSVNSGKEML